jgi:hypothetical protein
LLDGGVACEIRAHQTVPGPAIFSIGGGMNADPTATGLDEMLKRRFLGGVGQDITGGAEEDDSLVLGKIRIGEFGGGFGGVDGESVGHAERLNGGQAVGDGIMSEPSGCGKYEHLIRRGYGVVDENTKPEEEGDSGKGFGKMVKQKVRHVAHKTA